MAADDLGDLNVNITGDFSDLESALGEAQAAAASSGQAIGEALSNGAHQAESGLDGLYTKLLEVGEALAITEGMREFGVAALEAADNINRASIALTAITGSAEKAEGTLQGLEELGIKDGLAMPSLLTASTRMQQLLGPGADVAHILGVIADGAAVMGTDIGQAANMFDRMAASGVANARSLTSLGLSTTTLAEAINTVTGSESVMADGATKAFKALDQSDRIQVLEQALSGLAGTAEEVAKRTFGGQWIILSDQWEQIMVEVGNALLPVITELTNFGKTNVLPFIKSVVDGFSALPAPIKDTAVAVTLAVAALVPLVGGTAALALSLNLLRGLPVAVAEGFGVLAKAFGVAGEAATVAAGEVATAEVAMGSAGLAGALEGVAAAATTSVAGVTTFGTSVTQLGLFGEETAVAMQGTAMQLGLFDGAATAAAADVGVTATAIGGMGIAASTGTGILIALGAVVGAIQFKAYAEDVQGFAAALLAAAQQGKDYIAQSDLVKAAQGDLAVATDKAKFTWQDFLTVIENSNGTLLAARTLFEGLTKVLQAYTGTGPQIEQMHSMMLAGLQRLAPGQDALTKSLLAGAMAAAEQQLAIDKSVPSMDAFVAKAQALDDTLARATATEQEAAKQYAAGNISLTAYNLTVAAYDTALKAVQGTVKAVSDTVATITASFQKAQETFTASVSVFEKLSAASDGSSKSLALLAEAYAKAQSAATAAHQSFDNTSQDAQKFLENANKQVEGLTNVTAAYAKLKDADNDTAAGQLAISEAFAKVQSDATKAGLSVQQIGDALVFSVIDKSGPAADALGRLADQLNGVYSGSLQFVEVNGKLVPTLESVNTATSGAADAVIKLHDAQVTNSAACVDHAAKLAAAANAAWDMKAATEGAAGAVTSLSQAATTDAQSLADAANKAWDLKASLDAVTSSANDATSALDSESTAASKSSGGGKGGGGGGGGLSMSLDQLKQWISNAEQNASPLSFAISRFQGSGGVAFGQSLSSQMAEQGGINANWPIPMLGTGGTVMSPTLAFLAESGPEMVIPLDQVHSAGVQMGNAVNTLINPFLQSLAISTPSARSTTTTASGSPSDLLASGAIDQAMYDAITAASKVVASYGGGTTGSGVGTSSASGSPSQLLASGIISQQTYDAIVKATSVPSPTGGAAGTLGSSITTGPPIKVPTYESGTSMIGSFGGGGLGGFSPGGGGAGVFNMGVTLQGNYIGSDQMANALADKIQTAIVSKLRQAGLKI